MERLLLGNLAVVLAGALLYFCFPLAKPAGQPRMASARKGVPEHVSSYTRPVAPSKPGSTWPHCISINLATISVSQVSGRWKVVDNGHFVLDFDSRQGDAQKSGAIIQRYHMTESCTVGLPVPGEESPPFQYELVSGSAPAGSMPDEDCIGFNLATVTDQNIHGRWTVTDGTQLMFNFGDDKANADRVVAIIKHYAFTQSCFVGRPGTGGRYVFVYMKT